MMECKLSEITNTAKVLVQNYWNRRNGRIGLILPVRDSCFSKASDRWLRSGYLLMTERTSEQATLMIKIKAAVPLI